MPDLVRDEKYSAKRKTGENRYVAIVQVPGDIDRDELPEPLNHWVDLDVSDNIRQLGAEFHDTLREAQSDQATHRRLFPKFRSWVEHWTDEGIEELNREDAKTGSLPSGLRSYL
jgi:hypothetical protein